MNNFLDLVKMTGSSTINDIKLTFKDGYVSCYNASPDRVCASGGKIKTSMDLNTEIGIASLNIFQKYLQDFGRFELKDGKVVFKNENKKVSLPLVDVENVDSAVPEDKFKDWINVAEKTHFICVDIAPSKLKEIVADSKLIKVNNIAFIVGEKLTVEISDFLGGNIITYDLGKQDVKNPFKQNFNFPLLDIFNINFDDKVELTIAENAPLVIKYKEITYLIAPKTE